MKSNNIPSHHPVSSSLLKTSTTSSTRKSISTSTNENAKDKNWVVKKREWNNPEESIVKSRTSGGVEVEQDFAQKQRSVYIHRHDDILSLPGLSVYLWVIEGTV